MAAPEQLLRPYRACPASTPMRRFEGHPRRCQAGSGLGALRARHVPVHPARSCSPPIRIWRCTACTTAMFVVILSPVGSYFAERPGARSRSWWRREDVRAVRGGTGEAKCGGNYAAANRAGRARGGEGLFPGAVAGRRGAQVRRGGAARMNVMFKIAGKVVTPMLTGSILRRHHPPAPASRCSGAGACPWRSA